MDSLRLSLAEQRRSTFAVDYPAAIESAIAALVPALPETHADRRGLAVMLLSGDETLHDWLRARVGDSGLAEIERIRRQTAAGTSEPVSVAINRARLRAVDALLAEVETRPQHGTGSLLERVGHWSMHPVWGLPVLLVVLWGMYEFVGVLGAGTLVDLLETKFFGEHLSP